MFLFPGKNCETQINVCITKQPCQNNAPCSITADGYRCDCPLGYIGVHCEGSKYFIPTVLGSNAIWYVMLFLIGWCN